MKKGYSGERPSWIDRMKKRQVNLIISSKMEQMKNHHYSFLESAKVDFFGDKEAE